MSLQKKRPIKIQSVHTGFILSVALQFGSNTQGLEYLKHTASAKENIKRLQHIFIWHLICVEDPER